MKQIRFVLFFWQQLRPLCHRQQLITFQKYESVKKLFLCDCSRVFGVNDADDDADADADADADNDDEEEGVGCQVTLLTDWPTAP